jgi:hypothetical protein
MAKAETYFEQVPLERVAAIQEAEKDRLAKKAIPQPPTERTTPQPRSERKGRK